MMVLASVRALQKLRQGDYRFWEAWTADEMFPPDRTEAAAVAACMQYLEMSFSNTTASRCKRGTSFLLAV